MKNKFLFGFLCLFFLMTPYEGVSGSPQPPKSLGKKIVLKHWGRGLKTGKSKKRYFPEVASPIVDGSRVFVGTHSFYFYALDTKKKGKTLWQFKSNGPIASQPVSNEMSVFFGNNKGMVYALDVETGKLQWEYYVGGEVITQPAIVRDTLYVVTTSRDIYAIDAGSGSEKWATNIRGFEKKFTMRGNSPVIFRDGKLYIGFADGHVVSLSAGSGSLVWSRNLAAGSVHFKDVDAALLVEGSYLYAVGYFGSLVKLERRSGKVVWRKEVKSGTNIAMDDSTLYISSTDGRVVAFNKKNGFRRWDVPLHSGTLSSPLLFENYILVGTESGRAYVFDKKDGSVLQRLSLSPGYQSNAILDESSIYLLSSSGRLHALKLKQQQ